MTDRNIEISRLVNKVSDPKISNLRAADSLKTLSTIIKNIVDNTKEIKYRKIKVKSKTFQTHIAGNTPAMNVLLYCGFCKKVLEFEEWFVLENISDLLLLEEVLFSIQNRINFINERVTSEQNKKEKEDLENATIKENLLKEIESDRKERKYKFTYQ